MGQQDLGDFRDSGAAAGVLAARHGHGSVVEDLVGHCDTGCDCCLDGELSRVEERPVAHVLREVPTVHERRHTDPGGTFVAHCRHADGGTDSVLVHE